MTKESPEKIISHLEQDKIKNLNMLFFMENNPVHSLERINDSVILRGDSDQRWVYISSPDKKELTAVISTLTNDDRYFAVIEDWMLPLLTAHKKIAWQLTTMKLVLPDRITFPAFSDDHITSLVKTDAEYIYEHSMYQGSLSLDYIRERILKSMSAGIRISGKLVAWAMTHDDSAIGFLHVLKDYRRQGFAQSVMIVLIQKLRKQGKIPFVHIEETNVQSMQLALRLGFKKDRRVHWFEIQSQG